MARYIPGGRVVLADGTYELGGSVNLTRQKAHLMGMGGSTHLRPSTTGFTELVYHQEVHTRVADMLLFDSGDTAHDVTRAVYADDASFTAAWCSAERVHTHGATIEYRGPQGPFVLDAEFHAQPDPANNPGPHGILVQEDTGGANCLWPRLHGCWVDRSRQRGIFYQNVAEGYIEGCYVRRGSMENSGTYEAVRLSGDITDTAVCGNQILGDLFVNYGLFEDSTATSAANSILGNRLEGSGTTADLSVNGTDSLSGGNHADGTIK